MPKKSAPEDLTTEERAQLGARIRVLVEAAGTQAQASEIAGVTIQQLGRFMKTTNLPSFLPLARLADATGISLDWVGTGNEPKRRADAATGADLELLTQLARAVARVYEEERSNASDAEVARLIAEEYEIFSSANLSSAERPAGIRMAAERVRRELREAVRSRVVRKGA